jgi:hypothetical protein
LFVLTKIDENLAWEQSKKAERDTGFVELGRYCARYVLDSTDGWKISNHFDEFLERRFPESRRRHTTRCPYTTPAACRRGQRKI